MIERRKAISFLPATAVLEMTYQCNHRCLFCSCPWESPKSDFPRLPELTTGQWKNTLSLLCQRGVSNIAFTGGEPLLRSDLWEIVDHASKLETEHIETIEGKLTSRLGPPRLYLLSNGKLVDEAVLDRCLAYRTQLSMSLPGLRTFAAHTGSDSADHVLDCFALARAKGLDTIANVTVTRMNLSELRETLSAALLAGADQILLNRFLPGGRGLEHAPNLRLSGENIREMLDVAEDVLRTAGRFGSLGAEIPRCILGDSRYERLQVSTRCSAAVQFFVIDPSGYIRVCNHSPVRLNPIERMDDLKSNPYWKRFTQKDYLPQSCYHCPEIHECDGGCREAAHIATGHVDGLEELVLEKPQAERCCV